MCDCPRSVNLLGLKVSSQHSLVFEFQRLRVVWKFSWRQSLAKSLISNLTYFFWILADPSFWVAQPRRKFSRRFRIQKRQSLDLHVLWPLILNNCGPLMLLYPSQKFSRTSNAHGHFYDLFLEFCYVPECWPLSALTVCDVRGTGPFSDQFSTFHPAVALICVH